MEIHSLFACTVQHVVNHEVLLQGLSKKLSCEARGLEAGELLGCKLGVENESTGAPRTLSVPSFPEVSSGAAARWVQHGSWEAIQTHH